MSYLNLFTNSGLVPGPPIPDLGTGTGSGSSSSKNMSKVTIFGFTILLLYSITKILNFYGIGVEKYGPYLMFYVFLILCVNILTTEKPKI
jgi:hypothetical protein